jgi:hypothetical protein
MEWIKHKCERCGHELMLCPADYPWNEEFWICSKCESTYVKEIIDSPKSTPEQEK